MTTFGRLLVLGALATLTSCGATRRDTAEKTLQQVGATNLRRDAANFYKDLFVAPTGQYFLPKPNQWPPSFQRFEPREVRAYTDGFSLSVIDTRDGEEGLYVVPSGMDNIPREGRHARFQR